MKELEVRSYIQEGLGLLDIYHDYFDDFNRDNYEELLSARKNLMNLDNKICDKITSDFLLNSDSAKELFKLYTHKINAVVGHIDSKIFIKEQEACLRLVDEDRTELIWKAFGGK